MAHDPARMAELWFFWGAVALVALVIVMCVGISMPIHWPFWAHALVFTGTTLLVLGAALGLMYLWKL